MYWHPRESLEIVEKTLERVWISLALNVSEEIIYSVVRTGRMGIRH